MRLLCLLAILAGVLAVRPAAAGVPRTGVPVLMYHQVDAHTPTGPVGRSLTIEPAAFEAQLTWLHKHAIRTLTMNDLADALQRGEHPAQRGRADLRRRVHRRGDRRDAALAQIRRPREFLRQRGLRR